MKLEWDATEQPPDGRRLAIEEQVRNNIATELEDLDCPADLCFHHVFLGEDMEGESVFVYGKAGSDAFHCCYCPKTEWRPMDEILS